MVIETRNFLELEKIIVLKIFASSSLQIDSEVEVYNAANKWLNYNIEERKIFSKQMLSKVRLNLLSEQVLKYLQNESSCISENNECVKMLNNRDRQNMSSYFNKIRQCNQKMFNILIVIVENKATM